MKRNIQDRMSTIETETSLPMQIINPRPLQAAIKEFFSTNQLSQFSQQQNILAEIEHLRTLSALGPVVSLVNEPVLKYVTSTQVIMGVFVQSIP